MGILILKLSCAFHTAYLYKKNQLHISGKRNGKEYELSFNSSAEIYTFLSYFFNFETSRIDVYAVLSDGLYMTDYKKMEKHLVNEEPFETIEANRDFDPKSPSQKENLIADLLSLL
jgi:hypothetical protein